jgi:hypothetical protein
MKKRINILILTASIFLIPIVAQAAPDQGINVDIAVLNKAGGFSRSKTYAEATNPLNELRYEFMLTESGDVIYKKGADGWKYFGDMGFNLDKIDDFDASSDGYNLGSFDMIAADGNRIIAKKKGSNDLYFAALVKGGWDLNKDKFLDLLYLENLANDSFFLTSVPQGYKDVSADYFNMLAKNFLDKTKLISMMSLLFPVSYLQLKSFIDSSMDSWPSTAGIDKLKIVLRNSFALDDDEKITPIIPNALPVAVQPFKWYKIKAGFSDSNLTIIDAGVFEIHKISAAREQPFLFNYLKKFGSEYHRCYNQKFLFVDPSNNNHLVTEEERAYGTFVDGTVNYYVLTRNKKGFYQVWNIDEQNYFCSKWYKTYQIFDISPDPAALKDNWLKKEWKYRSEKTLEYTIGAFALCNKINVIGLLNIHGLDLFEQDYKNSLSSSLNDGNYSIKWREVGEGRGPNAEPWLWSAVESAENPTEERNLTVDQKKACELVFPNGKWDPNNDWRTPEFKYSAIEPTMDVSMENIVVCTDNKIYSINWGWGSMDHMWRVRDKPSYSFGTDVMINEKMEIYVPGYQGIDWGYWKTTLLPKDYLDKFRILPGPTYSYPSNNMIDGCKWEFTPTKPNKRIFANEESYEFPAMPPSDYIKKNPNKKGLFGFVIDIFQQIGIISNQS